MSIVNPCCLGLESEPGFKEKDTVGLNMERDRKQQDCFTLLTQASQWLGHPDTTVFVLVSHILVDKGPLHLQPHAMPTASHDLVLFCFFSLRGKLQLGPMS